MGNQCSHYAFKRHVFAVRSKLQCFDLLGHRDVTEDGIHWGVCLGGLGVRSTEKKRLGKGGDIHK